MLARLLMRLFIAVSVAAVLGGLTFVYVKPPESMKLTRDGVPLLSPPHRRRSVTPGDNPASPSPAPDAAESQARGAFGGVAEDSRNDSSVYFVSSRPATPGRTVL
jgi:hypothetical protein